MMSKNKLVLALAVIWLLVGIGLLSFYSKFDWNVLLGFATWVLAGGVTIAFWQIREARKSTNAQIAMDLFEELRNEETLKVLRYIYNLPPKEDGKCLSIVHKNEIDHVLNKFNMLGALVAQGIIDRQLTIETYGGQPAIRCWYKLYEYIRKEQGRRGYYNENYEPFARLSLDYFKKAKISIKLGEVDLVKVLQQDSSLRPRTLKEIKKGRKMTR